MAFRYLIDVDYTLMLMNNSMSPVYNEKLIAELQRLGVQEVDLLTRMDPTDLSPTRPKPLRTLLIKHLQTYGIGVGKVLTTMDRVFIQSDYFPELKLGDTYEQLMKPVEEASHQLAQIKEYSETHQQYTQYKRLGEKVKLLDFLFQNNFLSPEDTIDHVDKKKDQLLEGCNAWLLNYRVTKSSLDFSYIDHLLKELRYFRQKDPTDTENKQLHRQSTMGELYEEAVQLRDQALQLCKKITAEEQQIINRYLLELNYYTNLRLICSLRNQSKNQQLDSESSKGLIYTLYVKDKAYKQGDIVIFIDDGVSEQDAVQKAHASIKEHKLYTLLPPVHAEFDIPGAHIPHEEFRAMHSLYYFNFLYTEGKNALKSKNSHLAVECYKAAYILLDDIGSAAPITKKEMLQAIKEAYKTNNAQMPFTEQEEPIARCTSAFNRGSAEIRLRILEREQGIHELLNPHLYRHHFNLLNFVNTIPTEVDHTFRMRVLNAIKEIVSLDPSEIPELHAASFYLPCKRNCNIKYIKMPSLMLWLH